MRDCETTLAVVSHGFEVRLETGREIEGGEMQSREKGREIERESTRNRPSFLFVRTRRERENANAPCLAKYLMLYFAKYPLEKLNENYTVKKRGKNGNRREQTATLFINLFF